METHTINTKSWHYRFINRYKHIGEYNRPSDICQYRTWFINALFRMLVLATVLTLVILTPLTITGAWIAAGIMTGYWDFRLLPLPVVFFWAVVMVSLIMGATVTMFHFYMNWKMARLERRLGDGSVVITHKKPSTVVLAYRALKEKFCVKVEFE